MSSANRFLLTFLGRPQAHVLHAQACAAQEDDSPDSSSRRLTNARCKAAGGGGVATCAYLPGFRGCGAWGRTCSTPMQDMSGFHRMNHACQVVCGADCDSSGVVPG